MMHADDREEPFSLDELVRLLSEEHPEWCRAEVLSRASRLLAFDIDNRNERANSDRRYRHHAPFDLPGVYPEGTWK